MIPFEGPARIGRPVALPGGDEARVVRRRPRGTTLVYLSSIRRTEGLSAGETSVALRRPRFRPVAFLVRMWRFIECQRLTLPVAVSLNRFRAARLLFSFSFPFLAFLILRSPPSPRPPRPGFPAPSSGAAPASCPRPARGCLLALV